MASLEMGALSPEDIAEKNGENVKLHVILMRHGAKSPTGDLTTEGQEQAREVGRGLERPVKAYSSIIPRAYQSAESVIETAKNALTSHIAGKEPSKREPVKRIELAINPWSKEKLAEWKAIEKEQGSNAVVDWALKFGDKRPDEGTWSSLERAQMMAYVVEHYIKMTDKLKSNSDLDLVNLTHQSMPESLLQYAMTRTIDGKKVIGLESVSEIGGSLGPSETLEIFIDAKNKGDKSLSVDIRGNSYGLDMDKIHELATGYTKEKRQEMENFYNKK